MITILRRLIVIVLSLHEIIYMRLLQLRIKQTTTVCVTIDIVIIVIIEIAIVFIVDIVIIVIANIVTISIFIHMIISIVTSH